MAKRKTEKCPYQSRFTDSFVTAAQYITELICEKHAHSVYDGDLPRQFWKIKKWEKYYKYQIGHANRLVKKFPAKAIIDALLSPQTRKVYSLANPTLEYIIREFVKKEDPVINPERNIPDSTREKPRRQTRKNIVSKLKDLDDGI